MTTPTDGESDAEWMSAAEAIAFLGPNRSHAAVAICRHAKVGLVKARAKLFVFNGKTRSGDIPPEFWWAEGGDSLAQDWTTGHFKTQPFGGRIFDSAEAFGVRFRRSDILQLTPASAKPAGSLTSSNVMPALEPTSATALTSMGSLKPSPSSAQKTVFIGHGRSSEWLKLKEFLRDRLHLSPVEFNSTSTAGVATTERLMELLDQAVFAFLILTGEDEQPTGEFHPRLNVVHEAGLFQGKLGYKKAIILLEAGCEKFSNLHGLTDIRFPQGKIEAVFEDIRGVLEREKLI